MKLIIGNVYRIVCLSNPKIQYIGSTFNSIRNRWQQHKASYKRWIDGKDKTNISIYKYFLKYGIEDFKMIIIKSYLVCAENMKDHKHLSVYEQLAINRNTCVNRVDCFTVEYLSRLKQSQYYANNKEKFAEYNAKYRANNKDKMTEYQVKYYVKNKARIAEHNAK